VTPIRQQNPPGRPLKLLGLREKTGKNTDFFDFAKNISIFSVLVCNSPSVAAAGG
jgi:hypothetical protein